MNVFKRIIRSVIAMSAILTMAMPAFLIEDVELEEAAPRALQVLIVSEDGNTLYTGEEAERVFQELNSIPSYVEPEMLRDTSIKAELTSNDDVKPYGAFRYKYRFVPDDMEGTKVYGSYSIISNAWCNATSVAQTATVAFTATASWSVNPTLTGKFKEAVELAIGAEWGKEYTKGISHEIHVEPKKRVWLQYRPEYILHSGESQKYYITRGTGILIVEETQDVNVREAYMVNVTMDDKTYELPAGAYIWCEDSDYMAHNPPVVQS